jgi:uncharacterized protein (UPF0276 family)
MIGVSYRHAHRDALLAGPPRELVLEVVPDHFFADPDALAPLAERYPIVFHETGLSLATAGDTSVAKARLGRIAELARIARPRLFGDHLAITRSPSGIDLGHLAPVWLVPETLDLVCDRVRAIADVLGVPVVVENISAPFAIPHATMSEPEFFARLVERTGCGMLLDVTNLLVDTRNDLGAPRTGFSPDGSNPLGALGVERARARLREYPLAAVRQIHLAGPRRDRDARWIDSHSEPVDDGTYELLADVARARPPIQAIVVERDANLGSLDELIAEATRAARIWEEA